MSEVSNHPLKVLPLSEKPEYATVLAYLSFNEWYTKRDVPFEIHLKSYIKRARNTGIPCSFVALKGTYPVGMVSLKENDLWSRKDLNPWLASLWVHPDFRSLGAGGMLIDAVASKAVSLGLSRIYLFLGQDDSSALEEFYKKRNWNYLEDCLDNDGKPSKIFFKTI